MKKWPNWEMIVTFGSQMIKSFVMGFNWEWLYRFGIKLGFPILCQRVKKQIHSKNIGIKGRELKNPRWR
jgi:hypothetical protein